jgi:hypothetical protein
MMPSHQSTTTATPGILTGCQPASPKLSFCAAFNNRHATNPVALPADRSFTPTHAALVRRKPIAATA